MTSSHRYLPLFVFQIILAALFFQFTTYEKIMSHNIKGFEETHVMIFIGFAYLMTFLKKYCYSATGYNLFLAALIVQWNIICLAFLHMKDGSLKLSLQHLLEADIMSATVLITFGALLGLTSGEQLLFIAIIEGAVGNVNLYISEEIYEASDIGGSMGIHAYGAYFGLAVSAVLRMKKPQLPSTPSGMLGAFRGSQKEEVSLDGPIYITDVTAMIGTLFLWVYWPCFNSALASTEVERQRAKINTYLSLAACTVVTFVMSAEVSHKPGKLDMVHIQNSTLAGGVAVGAVANMYIGPGSAVTIGITAGCLSVLGYRYLTPMMEKYGIQDTCGVNNLHGMPGVYSGLLSALFAYLANFETYGLELGYIFPACASNVTVIIISLQEENKKTPPIVSVGDKRSMALQAAYQLIALATTLGLALGAGIISGLIAKAKIFSPLEVKQRYDDEINWELP